MSKQIVYDADARHAILRGVDKLAEAVRVTLGPKGPYAFIYSTVEDGVVTLNGRVPSLSHKRLAGALAWWNPGST